MNHYDNRNTIEQRKQEFVELINNNGRLKKLIHRIIQSLKRYEGFSLHYVIKDSNNTVLNEKIEAAFNRFNKEFPGFLKDPQDMINFFRYQRSILLSDSINEIQDKYGSDISYILGEGNNSIEGLKYFFETNKDLEFMDNRGHIVPLLNLFMTPEYYEKNYKKVIHEYGIDLPKNPISFFGLTWDEIKDELGLQRIKTRKLGEDIYHNVHFRRGNFDKYDVNNKYLVNIDDFSHFIGKHRNEIFIDSEGHEVLVLKLFSTMRYYKSNYKKVCEKYGVKLPSDPVSQYNISRIEIKLKILYEVINTSTGLFSSFGDFKEFCNYPGNLTALKDIENFDYLDGVYCDIDGTLIIDESVVNGNVVKFLIKKYQEGYKITLWTAGDTKKKIKLLEENIDALSKAGLTIDIMKEMGIISEDGTRNIKNKYNHKNDIVEIVVDDRNAKRFMYQVGIIPRAFVNVNSIQEDGNVCKYSEAYEYFKNLQLSTNRDNSK